MSAPSDNDTYHNSSHMAGKGRLPTWNINTFVTGLQEAASTETNETQNRSALKQTSASENTVVRVLDSPVQSGVQAESKLVDVVGSEEAQAVRPTSTKNIKLERVGTEPVLQTTQIPSKAHHVPLPPLRRPLDLKPPPLPPFVPPSKQQAQASTPPVALTLTGQPRKAMNPNVGTRVADCPSYRAAHVVPPPGMTLYRICQTHPQSIQGGVLKDFLRLEWTGMTIFNSLPQGYKDHLTSRVSDDHNKANIFYRRLKTMKGALVRKNEWQGLMTSAVTRQDGRPGQGRFVSTQIPAATQPAPQLQPPQAPQLPSTATVATPAPSPASATHPTSGTSAAWPAVNDPPRGIQASRDSLGNEDNPPVSKIRSFTASAAPLPLDPEQSPAHTGPVPSLPRLVTMPNGTAHPYIPTDVMKRIEATVTKKALPTARADEWSDSSDEEQDE